MRYANAVVTCCVLLSVSLLAQTAEQRATAPQKHSAAKPDLEEGKSASYQLGLDLLKRAHALNAQLADEERFNLLTGQIQTANRYDKTLGNRWAQELFELGKQGHVRSPGWVQLIAVNSIADSDPEAALKMLANIDPEAIAPRDDEYPGATIATKLPRNLFVTMVRNHGKKAIPRVRGRRLARSKRTLSLRRGDGSRDRDQGQCNH